MKTKSTLLTLALLATHIGAVNAVVTNATQSNASQTFFVASTTDLMNSNQSTFLSITGSDSMTFGGGAGGLPALNNGQTGALNEIGQAALAPDQTGFTGTITLNLNISVNTFGYEILAVQSIAAWDAIRSNQTYELFYATVSLPSNYISLGTVSTNLGFVGGATRVSFFDSAQTGIAIASGVSSLRLNYSVADFANQVSESTAFREIDVIGVASVPEPGTSTLLIAATAVMLARFRRRNSRA